MVLRITEADIDKEKDDQRFRLFLGFRDSRRQDSNFLDHQTKWAGHRRTSVERHELFFFNFNHFEIWV